MKPNHTFLACLLAGAIGACNPVPFDVDIEDFPHKITLNCYFNADSAWRFYLNESRSITEPVLSSLPGIIDATILIFDENNLTATITGENQTDYQRSSGFYFSEKGPSIVPKEGKTYTIQVSHSILGPITATCQVPIATPIMQVEKITAVPDANGEILVDVYFQDPDNEENYYELVSSYQGVFTSPDGKESVNYPELSIETSDPLYTLSTDILEFSKGPVLFSDNNVDGNLIKISGTLTYESFSSALKITPGSHQVILRTVTKEYYLHKTTEKLQITSRDNPFAQPVQVYSNVQNGFGIFAGYSKSVYKLPE